jgi:pimeloyl-ACP methyl ester carboxylesterase
MVRITERDITIAGLRWHYREAGEGQPVILLHALGADGSIWASTQDHLSQDFRVIAPDLIGFGLSDKPLLDYEGGLEAELLVEFLDALALPSVSLVGHSRGAEVAVCVAARHPAVVDRLVIVDGDGYRRVLALPPTRACAPSSAASAVNMCGSGWRMASTTRR